MKSLLSHALPFSLLSVLALGGCGLLVDNTPGLNDGKTIPEEDKDAPIQTQELKPLLDRISGIAFVTAASLCQTPEGKIIEVPATLQINQTKILSSTLVIQKDAKNPGEALSILEVKSEIDHEDNLISKVVSTTTDKITEVKVISSNKFEAKKTTLGRTEQENDQAPSNVTLPETEKTEDVISVELSENQTRLSILFGKASEEKSATCGDLGKSIGSVYEVKKQ